MAVEWEKYREENKELETVDLLNTDIKINPDFYIHLCLTKSIQVLSNENLEAGFNQFITLVNTLECFAKSAGLLDDDYITALEEFKKTNPEIDKINTRMRLSHFKQQLILERLFENKTITTPVKFK